MTRRLLFGAFLGMLTLAGVAALAVAIPYRPTPYSESMPPDEVVLPDTDAIKPFCGDSPPLGTSADTLPTFMDITIPKNRQWQQNLHQAWESPSNAIAVTFKKPFVARITVASPDSSACTYDAEVRLSGDWKDHLSKASGIIVASLDVKLQEGNIAGFVRFKLFLPQTRGGDNEIFTTGLLRTLDFLAPRTGRVEAVVNGARVTYLLQEKTAKELLESQLRREAPVYEADESMMWERRLHGGVNLDDPKYTTVRLMLAKWVGESENRFAIARRGLDILQRAHLDYVARIDGRGGLTPLNLALLANGDARALDRLSEYEALLYALNGAHALIPHNRQYYFDPISNSLEPIYYDGEPTPLETAELNAYASEYTSLGFAAAGAPGALTRLERLDQEQFLKTLALGGLSLDPGTLDAALARVKGRLRSLRSTGPMTAKAFWQPNVYAAVHGADRRLVFLSPGGGAEVCDARLAGCERRLLTLDERTQLIAGGLVLDGVRYIYVPGTIADYRAGIPVAVLNSEREALALGDGARLRTFGDVTVAVDAGSRTVSLTQVSQTGRALVTGGRLNGWTVRYLGNPAPLSGTMDRFDDHLLTGCLTFVDVAVNDLSVEALDTNCEDALNFIRVKGAVRRLVVRHAYEDGFDADFSRVDFGSIDVSDTGNDCLDVSSGAYTVGDLAATRCGDKGISTGERSRMRIRSANIATSVIGIVAKDWSTLDLGDVRISGSPVCAAAYRKKQEFGAGQILASSYRCESTETRIQDKSFFQVTP